MRRGHIRENIRGYLDVDCKQLVKRKIPITQWLPKYKFTSLFQDMLAGFTVGLTEIPQAIAYAGIAGLSPEYGLYSSFMGGFVYALFGSCKEINLGPTSIISLMLQPHVNKYGPDVAVLLCFLSGIIILLLGILNLGFVIEFFSYPIIAAFTCAASLQIAATQINPLFGISASTDSLLEALNIFFENLENISKWDTILGVVSLVCLILMRGLKRFGTLQYRRDWSKRRNVFGIIIFLIYLARNALVIIIGSIIAYECRKDNLFKITGEVHAGFPPLELPPLSSQNNNRVYSFLEIVSEIRSSVIFIPLLTILECVAIGKSFSNGKPLDASQEILTLGIGNLCSSFVRSMPITGSFTRSTINRSSGVQSPLGGVVTSLLTLLAIAFLTPYFYYVPKASIAAVIISAMVFLFETEAFVVLWKHKKSDLVPFLGTLVCCLFWSLEYGILIGILLNLLFILYPTARPKITVTRTVAPKSGHEIVLITPLDNLFYPAAETLREKVLQCEVPTAVIVVDGKYIRNIDITLAKSIVVFTEELIQRGHRIVFWNFKTSIKNICVGLNKTIDVFFKMGELEDIVEAVE